MVYIKDYLPPSFNQHLLTVTEHKLGKASRSLRQPLEMRISVPFISRGLFRSTSTEGKRNSIIEAVSLRLDTSTRMQFVIIHGRAPAPTLMDFLEMPNGYSAATVLDMSFLCLVPRIQCSL